MDSNNYTFRLHEEAISRQGGVYAPYSMSSDGNTILIELSDAIKLNPRDPIPIPSPKEGYYGWVQIQDEPRVNGMLKIPTECPRCHQRLAIESS